MCKKFDFRVQGRIGKPTTLGKIERWHRTYDVERPRFKRDEQFIKYYSKSTYVIELHDTNRSVTHVVA